ncbi:MAG: BolA/IbaG family iron-sulfur metabolism protein, partial [Sulfuriferula multivorans]|nr:BolA/IbaG family iron-sulfur metabolism protein [Sulfuriferula multivorans]
SVAVTNHLQQADTGTKMIHLGKNTRSTIVSKPISAGRSNNSYRGLARISPKAVGARNYSQCDSMLIGDGGVGHFRVRVIDAGFNALQRIARNRLVYAAVSDWIPERGHALKIIAMARE